MVPKLTSVPATLSVITTSVRLSAMVIVRVLVLLPVSPAVFVPVKLLVEVKT